MIKFLKKEYLKIIFHFFIGGFLLLLILLILKLNGGKKIIIESFIGPVILGGLFTAFIYGLSKHNYYNIKNELINEKASMEKILQTTHDGYWMVNLEGKIIDVNQAYINMIGYSRKELLEMSISKLEATENNLETKNHIEIVKNKDYVLFETKHRTKSGKIIDVEISVSFVDMENPFLVSFIRDITGKKVKNKEIKNIKERLELAVEGANLGIWDWNINEKREYVDQRYAKMLGYNMKELNKNQEVFRQLIHPEDEKIFEDILNKHVNGDTSYYKAELRFKTDCGKYKWINDVGKVFERDEDGCPIRAVGIHQDIDDRKEAEKKLKQQEAHFEQLFKNSAEGIVLLDNNQYVLRANKKFEEIFGYKESDIKGKNVDDLIIPEEYKDEGHNYAKQVEKGNTITEETVRKKKSGKRIDVFLHGFPVKLADDQMGAYGVYNNITERKEREAKIEFLSFHDKMTGLYNRRYFENEMERLNETRRLPISIIIGDMDGLKDINDNYGHRMGDKFIEKCAEIINTITRSEDIVARIGGDEFAIILPGTNTSLAKELCERIQSRFNQYNRTSKFPELLSISLGFANKEKRDDDLNKVFNKADKIMYENKKQSR